MTVQFTLSAIYKYIKFILCYTLHTLREESSQTNVILQYKLTAAIVSELCSVIQKS